MNASASKEGCRCLPICGQSSWSEDASHTEFIDVHEGSSASSSSKFKNVMVDSYPALSSQNFCIDADGVGVAEVESGFRLESEFEYWDEACGKRVRATLRDILDTQGVTEAARKNTAVLEEQPELFLCGAEAALAMEVGVVTAHGIAMRLRLAEVLSRINPSIPESLAGCLPEGRNSPIPEVSIKSSSLLDMMLTDEGCLKVRRAALRTCFKYYAPMPDLNEADSRGRVQRRFSQPPPLVSTQLRTGSRRSEQDCCNNYCRPPPEETPESTSACVAM